MMRTLLLVDDHGSFRAMSRVVLSEGFDVVGEACDGAQAVNLARELRPEVVLLDMQLPDSDGFTIAEALALQPDPPLVVLTSSRDRRDFGPALQEAAARGFIGKEHVSVEALVALLPSKANTYGGGCEAERQAA